MYHIGSKIPFISELQNPKLLVSQTLYNFLLGTTGNWLVCTVTMINGVYGNNKSVIIMGGGGTITTSTIGTVQAVAVGL